LISRAAASNSSKFPIHPELARVLAAVPPTQMTFIQTLRGKPFPGHSFSQWFMKACAKAGLDKRCKFHGLRKAACRRLAEAGCSANEIAAISGRKTLRDVSGDPWWRNPITGVACCCARAASGHPAAPLSSVMKSRRFIR
jgi:Phage integrase family